MSSARLRKVFNRLTVSSTCLDSHRWQHVLPGVPLKGFCKCSCSVFLCWQFMRCLMLPGRRREALQRAHLSPVGLQGRRRGPSTVPVEHPQPFALHLHHCESLSCRGICGIHENHSVHPWGSASSRGVAPNNNPDYRGHYHAHGRANAWAVWVPEHSNGGKHRLCGPATALWIQNPSHYSVCTILLLIVG